MAEAPSEAAIQESQIVPSKSFPLPFVRPCLTVGTQATGMNYASEVEHVWRRCNAICIRWIFAFHFLWD